MTAVETLPAETADAYSLEKLGTKRIVIPDIYLVIGKERNLEYFSYALFYKYASC